LALTAFCATRLKPGLDARRGEEAVTVASKSSYALMLLASWLLFSALLRWQIWHSRLLLPLAVLAAPWLGWWLSRQRGAFRLAAGTLLLAGALPVLFLNRSRPLLGPDSVLTTPREQQYFANRPELHKTYHEAAAVLRQHGAQHSLLYLSGDSWEYPLWVMARPEAPLRSGGVLPDGERTPGAALPGGQATGSSGAERRNGQATGSSGTEWRNETKALRPETAPTLLLCWKEELLARDTLFVAGAPYARRGAPPLAGAPGVYVRWAGNRMP
jgi:hypothetical protein